MGIDEDIASDVRAHGYQLICISDTPPFIYSIGLMPQHPEAVIFGLEKQIGSQIMSTVAKRVKLNEVFEHRGVYDIGTGPGPLAIRRVHPTKIPLYFGYAMGYCRLMNLGDVRAIQVLWPDSAGKYPFDAGCDQHVYNSQPRLDISLTPREVAKWERLWE